MNISGKRAIVTGGSRGIGRAVVERLRQEGAEVVFSYHGNREAAEETSRTTGALGVQADAALGAGPLLDAAMERFGGVDILVNCAGITRDGLLLTMKADQFDEVIAANLRGTFLAVKAVCRPMIRQKWGRIVNISSVVGLRGNAGQANYAASKAGVIGLTKSAAKELSGRGITVNAVAPGFIRTDMTAAMPDKAREAALAAIPMGRMGEPRDVAAAAAFLCSEEAGYITGQVLCVDGGMAV